MQSPGSAIVTTPSGSPGGERSDPRRLLSPEIEAAIANVRKYGQRPMTGSADKPDGISELRLLIQQAITRAGSLPPVAPSDYKDRLGLQHQEPGALGPASPAPGRLYWPTDPSYPCPTCGHVTAAPVAGERERLAHAIRVANEAGPWSKEWRDISEAHALQMAEHMIVHHGVALLPGSEPRTAFARLLDADEQFTKPQALALLGHFDRAMASLSPREPKDERTEG